MFKLKLFSLKIINIFHKNIFPFSTLPSNPYELLGVTKQNNQSQIKKAYYKLAQLHHPDKNPTYESQEKFKQINNAYEILSNASKKQMYDETGTTESVNTEPFYQGYQSYQETDPDKAYRNTPQFKSWFEQFLKDLLADPPQDASRITSKSIYITIEESALGCKKFVKFKRQLNCKICNGTGGKPGTEPIICDNCHGDGLQVRKNGGFTSTTSCHKCKGNGKVYIKKCTCCKGKRIKKQKIQVEVIIPRGTKDYHQFVIQKKGHFKGKLFIIIYINYYNSYQYERKGNDCYSRMNIPLAQAISGVEKKFVTVEKKEISVKIPAGIKQMEKIVIEKEGFYEMNTDIKGNLILTIYIQFPKNYKMWDQQQQRKKQKKQVQIE